MKTSSFPKFFNMGNSSIIKKALEEFKSNDEMRILSELNNLCSELSMASDKIGEDIKIVDLIKELINLLDKFPFIPEISIMSLNCINYLLDINPNSTSSIIKFNGVQKIVLMSNNVESIDGVESAIKAIEKMSYENPYVLVEKNAFLNILSFIDFFDLPLRKTALKACVNMSKKGNNFEFFKNHIEGAIPNLTNLSRLNGNSDIEKNIVDLAIQCFYNIIIGIKNYGYSLNYNAFCNEIIKFGLLNVLLENFIKFINYDYDIENNKNSNTSNFSVNVDTIKNILKIFETLCCMSDNITNLLLNQNMLEMIHKVIKNEINYTKNDGSKVNTSNTHSLFNELFNLLASFFPSQINKDNIGTIKTKIMSDENKHFYKFFSENILSLLIDNILNISSSSTTLGVIKIINMYCANSSLDYIKKHINNNTLSSIISKMLDSRDSSYIIEVLSLVNLIMSRIPEYFVISFLRDGVVENISKLENVSESSLYITNDININRIPNKFDIKIENINEDNEKKIVNLIRINSNNIMKNFFNKNNIKQLIQKSNSNINPIQIMNQLNDYSSILKDNQKIDEQLIFNIINLLIENECTFFEIEKSGIILNLAYYFDNNFLTNYQTIEESNTTTKVTLCGNYNRDIIHRIQTLYKILKFNENEEGNIEKFIKLLQRCISSMNCFKLLLNDYYNNMKNATSLFLSAFNGSIPSKLHSKKIKFKLNYNEAHNQIVISKEVNLNNNFKQLIDLLNKKKCHRLYFETKSKIEDIKKAIFDLPNNINLNFDDEFIDDYEEDNDYFQEIFKYFIQKDSNDNNPENNVFEVTENFMQKIAERRIERPNRDKHEDLEMEKINFEYKKDIQKFDVDNLMKNYDLLLYIVTGEGEIFKMKPNLTLSEFLIDAKKNLKKPDFKNFCFDFIINFSFIERKNIEINLPKRENQFTISKETSFNLNSENQENFLLENYLFEKYYYTNIINNNALYNIKRASPFFYLLSLIHLSSNFFSNLFKVQKIKLTNFENSKMTSLLSKQIKDPYAITSKSIPSWCTEINNNYPFFTSFSSRYLLFKVTAFDKKRSMTNLYIFLRNFLGENIFEDKSMNNLITNLNRKKYKINRNKILTDSLNLMNNLGNYNGYIEFEYENETGTGMGPTLEFYSLFAKEIIENNKNIWYKTEDYSLFPLPLINNENDKDKIKDLFKVIGYVIARALYDDRLIDIPLNSLFWDLVLDRPINLKSIEKIDKNISDFLIKIYNSKRNSKIGEKILIDNQKIESLDIYFNCPWDGTIELKKNSKNTILNDNNIDEYINLVFNNLLIEGQREIIKSFKEGFNIVFDINLLKSFSSEEIEYYICGNEISEKNTNDDIWSYDNLTLNIIPMHGYNKNSLIYKGLIDILQNMSKTERKMFLLFVTGSPRLPIGGFKNLYPKLTVVQSQNSNFNEFANPDLHLPSVMTCQNYLKIPNYSSVDVLKIKLNIAIEEGGNAFHLS